MGFPSSIHQDIKVFRASIMKTRSGRFDFSEIGCRIVFHAGRSLLSVQFREFGTLPAPRRGCARFFACAANESAKRFAGDIKAGVGEPLPNLFVRLSRAQRDFNFKQKRTENEFVHGEILKELVRVSAGIPHCRL